MNKFFKFIASKKMKHLYVCGPTVYDASHLGHARTYISVDMINKVYNNILREPTLLVMNITDIDDKIINKANFEGCSWKDIATKYEQSFFDSMSKINVDKPDVIIRVSECLPDIIAYIQQIINNGFAYRALDGSIYFDTNRYMEAGYHVNIQSDKFKEKLSKKNSADFALWKSRNESEVGFDATFTINNIKHHSYGRPGWHIECSAMIAKTIGKDLDIHLGGIDLKFPHHQNEEIQANAYYHPEYLNDKWVKDKFIHIGHLCVAAQEGGTIVQQKMSKSLKNFTTIDEAMNTLTSNEMRWMFSIHNYSDSLTFDENTISECKIYNAMVTNFLNHNIQIVGHHTFSPAEINMLNLFIKYQNEIYASLRLLRFDLMSTLLRKLIRSTNTYIKNNQANEKLLNRIILWTRNLLSQLGFDYVSQNNESIDNIMAALIDTRSKLRLFTKKKNVDPDTKKSIFEILDEQRDIKLPNIGIKLTDTKVTSNWYPV